MKPKSLLLSFAAMLLLLLNSSCYSFKGIAINPNANTYYVAPFDVEIRSDEVPPPPNLDITFSEALKDRIRNETRLKFKEIDPDIEFSGAITGYAVTAEAPEAGETTSFSRLTITIKVEYIDHKGTNPEPQNQTFNFFEDFPTNQNLLSIQDDLIDDIFEDLTEKVFNWAFNNW